MINAICAACRLMKQNVKKAKIPLYLSNEESYVLESATTMQESKRKTGKSPLEQKHYF